MSTLARFIVVAGSLFFVWLTAAVFAAPAFATWFLRSFASSARAHYAEQIARLIFSASLISLSPVMLHPGVFRVIGWGIFLSSVVLVLIPWQWHDRLGERVRPVLVRYMKVYAVGSFLFGAILLYGVFARH